MDIETNKKKQTNKIRKKREKKIKKRILSFTKFLN